MAQWAGLGRLFFDFLFCRLFLATLSESDTINESEGDALWTNERLTAMMTDETRDRIEAALIAYREHDSDSIPSDVNAYGGLYCYLGGEKWVVYEDHANARAHMLAEVREMLEEQVDQDLPQKYARFVDLDAMAEDEALTIECGAGVESVLACYDGVAVELEDERGRIIATAYRAF